jgi:hypothetical protein
VKLSVPDLNVVDQFRLDVPVRQRRTNVWKDVVQRQGATVLLSSIVTNYTPNKPLDPETPHDSLRVFDLTQRKDLSTRINLAQFAWGGGIPSARPEQALVSVSRHLVAVRGKSDKEQITTIDLDTGRLLASFASEVIEDFVGLNDMQLTASGALLIGAVSQLPRSAGGLYVWEPRTGRLLQRLPRGPVSWIALSPDDRRLAAIVLSDLHVYRVNRP